MPHESSSTVNTPWSTIPATLLILAAIAACATPPLTATPLPAVSPETAATAAPSTTGLLTVCAAGCDFTTIQAAIDDAGTTTGDTITVTDATHTEMGITVDKDVTIQGQGAGSTTVQAHAVAGSATDRVFLIAEGATVTVKDMTIRHGQPTVCPQSGGGIMNLGTLTLEDSIVSRNTASSGGGIMNDGTLTITNSAVSHNTADGSGNRGTGRGSGGGIKNMVGMLTIVASTISDNTTVWSGGGIKACCQGTVTLINSTVSGNRAARTGGGIHVRGTVALVHSTISGNRAAQNGGGVHVEGTLDYTHTIIANNTAGLEAPYGIGDCAIGDEGTIGTNANNLVGDDSCSPDYSGDPKLDILANNGGDTQTHALLPGSPAVDAIPAADCMLTTDQRGASRPIPYISTRTPCDVGAFELQPE
jgi:hypothetical protein